MDERTGESYRITLPSITLLSGRAPNLVYVNMSSPIFGKVNDINLIVEFNMDFIPRLEVFVNTFEVESGKSNSKI